MLTAWECIFGVSYATRGSAHTFEFRLQRANRAQYTEVSLQTFDEGAALRKSVVLPSLEGLAEDQGI